MKLPNILTLSRFHAAFLFIFIMSFENFGCRIAALVIFIIAAITDWYDGYLARLKKIESNYGRVFDPLADKVLTCSAYIFFTKANFFANITTGIPAWIVSLIIIREFAVSGLRTLALYSNSEIVTSKLGKLKTFTQIIAIVVIIMISIIDFYYEPGTHPQKLVELSCYIPLILMALNLIITGISGIDYIAKNKKIFYGSI